MSRISPMLLLVVGCIAAADAKSTLNFLVMGDWGGSDHSPYTTKQEVVTAGGMGKIGKDRSAKFALALGDNFYDSGVKDEHDKRFKTTFEEVFTADALKGDNFFRVVAGNHDHNGNVTGQIAYSSHSSRWSFPSLYYTFTETAPDGATVQVVYIDTVKLSGDSTCALTGVELSGDAYPGPGDEGEAQTQMQWLEATLAASTADYLIVAGHYPVWSICEHGPTSQLVKDVKPLLEKYHVTAYMNGHDHCAEHIDEGKGVDYHTVGSAHEWSTSTAHKDKIPKDSLKFHPSQSFLHPATTNGGFALASVNKTAFVVSHYSGKGDVLYTAKARKPRK